MKEFLSKFNAEELELERLYHSLESFQADFSLIMSGRMTFNDLQDSFDKDIGNIKDDMEMFRKMAFYMMIEINKELSKEEK